MLSPLLDFLNNLKNPPLKLDFSNRDPAASKYSILFSVTLSFLNAVSLLEKPGLYPIKCSIIWIYPSASSWHFTFSFVPCLSYEFSSVQPISCVQLFVTSWTARQASLSITNFWSPPKPMCMELMMPSSHLILCRPLLLLPSIFPSIRVFSDESPLHIRWSKYWNFSFSISPSNEHPRLISFGMDWLDLLAVQGTLKSLLQPTVQKHQIFNAQLSL